MGQNRFSLLTPADLAPLRNRADFAALLWDIAESSGQPAVGSGQQEKPGPEERN